MCLARVKDPNGQFPNFKLASVILNLEIPHHCRSRPGIYCSFLNRNHGPSGAWFWNILELKCGHDVPFSISSKFMQIQYQGMSPMWFYLLKFLVSANISWEICEGEAETSHAEPRRQAVRKNGDFTMIEDRSRVGLTKINSFSSFSDTNSGLSGPKYLRHQATLFPDPESLSAVWWIFVGELGLWWISDDICRDWGRKKAKEFAWMVGTSATVRRQILAAFTHVLQHTRAQSIKWHLGNVDVAEQIEARWHTDTGQLWVEAIPFWRDPILMRGHTRNALKQQLDDPQDPFTAFAWLFPSFCRIQMKRWKKMKVGISKWARR